MVYTYGWRASYHTVIWGGAKLHRIVGIEEMMKCL